MVNVTHNCDDRSTTYPFSGQFFFARQQFHIDVVARNGFRNMTKLFNSQYRRILINDLVNRDHRAQIEQNLDDLVTLDRHALRKLGYRDVLGNLYFMDNRCGRPFETVLRIATEGNCAPACGSLAFTSTTFVAGYMQFSTAITRFAGFRLGLGLVFRSA